MRGLRRLMLWGATAAGAVFIAALTSRSEVGAQRVAAILHGRDAQTPTQVAAENFDAAAETRRLSEQLRGLAASDQDIKSRLAAVEHGMDDVTGSISKEIEAASAARRSEDGPSVAATAALSAAVVPAVVAPPATRPAFSGPQLAAIEPAGEPAPPRTEYGVDIGSGLTVDALRTRWLAIRGAHPQLLNGLQPVVNVKDVPHANRIELRLIAGPFAKAEAAAQLCAALAAFGLFCQPTVFDGQHLTLR